MPVRVDIPTRVTVDVPALTERRGDIEEAVAVAVGRALSTSAAEVLEPRGGYAGTRLNRPEVSWWGDGLAAVPATVRADVEDAIRAAVADAASEAGMPRIAGDGASTSMLKPPVASIDDARYDALLGLYELPVFDAAGEKTTVPVKRRAAKRKTAVQHEPFEWWPLTQAQAQTIYSWTVLKAGIVPPAKGYMGAIYAEPSGGMRIDVVKYPEETLAFTTQRIGLSELVAESVREPLAEKPATQLPAVSTYWLELVATKDDGDLEERLRGFLRPLVRDLLKPKRGLRTDAEFDAAVETRLNEQLEAIKADPDHADVTAFMRLRIDYSSFLVRTRGAVPPKDMERVRLIPLARPSGAPGEGATGAAAGAEGAAAGAQGEGISGAGIAPGEVTGGRTGAQPGGAGVEGGVEGAAPLTSPPAFIEMAGGTTTGSLFPPTSGETVKLVCRSYLGEPSMDQLGADGKRMQQLADSIAWRLQIDKCKFAGGFLLNAAEALGGRAGQVEDWEVEDQGAMQAAPAGGGNVGNVTFIPTPGPQIQFMRHLATVVPLISELKTMVNRVYRERGDLIEGVWKGQPLSWLNRWQYDFVVKGMERHVGLLFVMTCNVIFRQLLNTSRENLRKRNNPGFFGYFRQMIVPQLVDLDELLRAREILQAASAIEWTMRNGPSGMRDALRDVRLVVAPSGGGAAAPPQPPETWSDAATRVVDALVQLVTEGGQPAAEKYELLCGEGQSYRVRDKRGRVWDLRGLEATLTMRRGGLEELEPLVKQLTDLPEVVDRFRGKSDDDVEYEIYLLIKELLEKNAETIEEARTSSWYGFRASTIIENLRGATVKGTNFALQGIHKQAHDQIGEFFGGDVFYGLGIESVFAAELGRKELAAALEFSAMVLLAVVCPPAAAGVGLASAIHHYAEAEERRDIYMSLTDPEKVVSAAEVEAGMFAAKLGLVLALIPAGAEVGSGARAAMGGLARRAGVEVAEEVVETGARVGARALAEPCPRADTPVRPRREAREGARRGSDHGQGHRRGARPDHGRAAGGVGKDRSDRGHGGGDRAGARADADASACSRSTCRPRSWGRADEHAGAHILARGRDRDPAAPFRRPPHPPVRGHDGRARRDRQASGVALRRRDPGADRSRVRRAARQALRGALARSSTSAARPSTCTRRSSSTSHVAAAGPRAAAGGPPPPRVPPPVHGDGSRDPQARGPPSAQARRGSAAPHGPV